MCGNIYYVNLKDFKIRNFTHKAMVEEIELQFKHQQSKLRRHLDDDELVKTFTSEVKHGNLTKVVKSVHHYVCTE